MCKARCGCSNARAHAGVEKFVYAASSSCYGLAATPTREDHPIKPQYPYALSKYQGEQASFHWHAVYGLPVNSICIFNAYGTRVRTTGAYGAVFGVFLETEARRQALHRGRRWHPDARFRLRVGCRHRLSRGRRDGRSTGERFNVGAGHPQSVNRLVELIGGDVVYVPKRPGEPDCTFADIGKITRTLGWKPVVAFEDGVARMVREIEHWRDAPLWDPESIAVATRTWFKYLGSGSAAEGHA